MSPPLNRLVWKLACYVLIEAHLTGLLLMVCCAPSESPATALLAMACCVLIESLVTLTQLTCAETNRAHIRAPPTWSLGMSPFEGVVHVLLLCTPVSWLVHQSPCCTGSVNPLETPVCHWSYTDPCGSFGPGACQGCRGQAHILFTRTLWKGHGHVLSLLVTSSLFTLFKKKW